MSNIIWKQPNNTLAVTSIFDGSSPQDHAVLLKYRGDVPADWTAVAFNHQNFPSEAQESWRWDGTDIVVNAEALRQIKYSGTVSAFQIRVALNQLNLRSQVEAAVAAGDQDLKDAWAFAPRFNRFNAQVLAMQSALNLTDAQVDALFDLAATH